MVRKTTILRKSTPTGVQERNLLTDPLRLENKGDLSIAQQIVEGQRREAGLERGEKKIVTSQGLKTRKEVDALSREVLRTPALTPQEIAQREIAKEPPITPIPLIEQENIEQVPTTQPNNQPQGQVTAFDERGNPIQLSQAPTKNFLQNEQAQDQILSGVVGGAGAVAATSVVGGTLLAAFSALPVAAATTTAPTATKAATLLGTSGSAASKILAAASALFVSGQGASFINSYITDARRAQTDSLVGFTTAISAYKNGEASEDEVLIAYQRAQSTLNDLERASQIFGKVSLDYLVSGQPKFEAQILNDKDALRFALARFNKVIEEKRVEDRANQITSQQRQQQLQRAGL